MMTLELGFPRPCLNKIAPESINDSAGPKRARKWRQRELGLVVPLESQKELSVSARVWKTAGSDQCVTYSNGKFQENSSQC